MSGEFNPELNEEQHATMNKSIDGLSGEVEKLTKIIVGNGSMGLDEAVRVLSKDVRAMHKRLQQAKNRIWDVVLKYGAVIGFAAYLFMEKYFDAASALTK